MLEKIEKHKDFMQSLSKLTGIPQNTIESYNKGSLLNLIEHPGVLDLSESQLEKVHLLRQFFDSYRHLQVLEQNQRILLSNTQASEDYFLSLLGTMKTREMFLVAFLDKGHHLIETRVIAKGGVDICLVNPRDIVKTALNCDCSSIILAHNHPGNSKKFSHQDIELTKNMQKTLAPLNIRVLDHLLVANYQCKSMVEAGIFPSPGPLEVSFIPTGKDEAETTKETGIRFLNRQETVARFEEEHLIGKSITLSTWDTEWTWIAIDGQRPNEKIKEFTSLEKACIHLLGETDFINLQPDIEKEAQSYLNRINVQRSEVCFSAWMADKVIRIEDSLAVNLLASGLIEIFGVDDQEHEFLIEDKIPYQGTMVIEKKTLDMHVDLVQIYLGNHMEKMAYMLMAHYLIDGAQWNSENNWICSFPEIEERFKITLTDDIIAGVLTALNARDETAAATATSDEGFYVTVYANDADNENEVVAEENDMEMGQ